MAALLNYCIFPMQWLQFSMASNLFNKFKIFLPHGFLPDVSNFRNIAGSSGDCLECCIRVNLTPYLRTKSVQNYHKTVEGWPEWVRSWVILWNHKWTTFNPLYLITSWKAHDDIPFSNPSIVLSMQSGMLNCPMNRESIASALSCVSNIQIPVGHKRD